MNTYFSNIVPLLDIQGYKSSHIYNTDIDEIQNYINKFKAHPSILKIKEKYNTTESSDLFFFSVPSTEETLHELEHLNNNKPTTDNNIPAKILKERKYICALL